MYCKFSDEWFHPTTVRGLLDGLVQAVLYVTVYVLLPILAVPLGYAGEAESTLGVSLGIL